MQYDRQALTTALGAIPSIVASYVANVPEGDLDARRAPDAWTVREHVYHIAGVQKMLTGRIGTVATEPNPVIVPYFPQNEPAIGDLYPSVESALADYARNRAEQIALLASIPDGAFEKRAEHPEYREYSLPVILNHMVFHEYWHMYRIEELWLTREEYFGKD